jgi:hypothetical protein
MALLAAIWSACSAAPGCDSTPPIVAQLDDAGMSDTVAGDAGPDVAVVDAASPSDGMQGDAMEPDGTSETGAGP